MRLGWVGIRLGKVRSFVPNIYHGMGRYVRLGRHWLGNVRSN